VTPRQALCRSGAPDRIANLDLTRPRPSWTHGDSPAFLAMARVPPQHQQQLAPLLRLIAVERGDGSFELQLK